MFGIRISKGKCEYITSDFPSEGFPREQVQEIHFVLDNITIVMKPQALWELIRKNREEYEASSGIKR